jgi:hypothetical protein
MAGALVWLEQSALAAWIRESPSIWAYSTILTLHTLGLGIVVGASAVVDLRLLGFARRIPLPTLRPLFAVLWWGFALNAVTGVLLFMSDATHRSQQPVFYVKLGLVALALWIAHILKTIVSRDGEARLLAGVSLALWMAAIVAGRLMAYL